MHTELGFLARLSVLNAVRNGTTSAPARPISFSSPALVHPLAGVCAASEPETPQAPPGAVDLPLSLMLKMVSAKSGVLKEAAMGEINRIVSLPVARPLSAEELEAFSASRLLAGAYQSGFRLFPTQANGLSCFERYGVLFGNIGVGWGKTLLALMVCQHAFVKWGVPRIILNVPPDVLSQFQTDIRWARTKVPISYPIHILGARTAAVRLQIARSGHPGLYVIPHSLMQAKDADSMIQAIQPRGWIADEAHMFANQDAARTKRILRYLRTSDCFFVPLSGTMTTKSIKDYWPLLDRAMGGLSPLPRDKNQVADWANMIDANADPQTGQSGPITPLCHWAAHHFPSSGPFDESLPGFRRAYRSRLTSAPGVITSGESDIGVSLIFHNEPVAPEKYRGAEALKILVEQAEVEYLTPNGDQIEDPRHLYKWLYELSAGFYNRLFWESSDLLSTRLKIPAPEADRLLDAAQTHHGKLQWYHSNLRGFLAETDIAGLDSPLLVGQDMHRNGSNNVPAKMYAAWLDAKRAEVDGMPERQREAILVCDYKIEAAIEWVKRVLSGDVGGGCILWYYHIAIGRWLVECAKHHGIDTLFCPAGSDAAICDVSNAGKVVVASMAAHHKGKNLQHHYNQYLVEWMKSSRETEQLLGRCHRNGQKQDTLVVCTNRSNLFDEMTFGATLNDSIYHQLTTGNRIKLVYGTHDPLPRIFSPETLRARGMEPKMLTVEQRTFIAERFGDYVG